MNPPVLFASALIIGVVIAVIGVVVFLIINKAGGASLGLTMSAGGYNSGENVEGSVALKTGKDLPAERLLVSLVGVYEETRRKARSTVGYDEDDDQWDTTTTEVFRHDEELPVELPVPKRFKGEIPFSFPAPAGAQVSVRTPAGGIKQGAEIPIGDLPGAGTASLSWTISVSLEGTDVEPVTQMIGIGLA